LELQTLAALATVAIRAFDPAILVEQRIGSCHIKFGTGSIFLIAWYESGTMISTQWLRFPTAGHINHSLMVNGHGNGLPHLPMLAQDWVLEVEEHPLKVNRDGRGYELIVAQALIGR